MKDIFLNVTQTLPASLAYIQRLKEGIAPYST